MDPAAAPPDRTSSLVERKAPDSETDDWPAAWSTEWIEPFRRKLEAFFQSHARRLPWRGEKDPYRILVSEFMLQQTRVDTVLPYYAGWMERFPTLSSLAEADLDQVLKLWEGLGYYTRARNLHNAVREIAVQHDGVVPSDPDALQSLSGVGPYTAGAVASIAFGVPAPAVDGNVRRVLARLTDQADPPPRVLQKWAAALVDPDDPGGFNQALMELGSLICRPRDPHCSRCPVETFCLARKAGTQEERPAPRRRRRIPQSLEVVAVLVVGSEPSSRALLRKRPNEGFLGGMWEFPGTVVASSRDSSRDAEDDEIQREWEDSARSLARRLGRLIGAPSADLPIDTECLVPVDHVYSHKRVRYQPFVFRLSMEWVPERERMGFDWVDAVTVEELPLSAAQRRIAEQLWRCRPESEVD